MRIRNRAGYTLRDLGSFFFVGGALVDALRFQHADFEDEKGAFAQPCSSRHRFNSTGKGRVRSMHIWLRRSSR